MHLCVDCDFHGFPCLNCAENLNGEFGPGFVYGKRAMILAGLEQDTYNRMIAWMNETGTPCYIFEDSDHFFNFLMQEEPIWPNPGLGAQPEHAEDMVENENQGGGGI